MAVNVISTTKAPGAVGPYSQAIKAGDFLFASGQIAINPEKGKIVSGGVVEQAEQCMKIFGAVNEVYGKYFQKTLPARSCVEISRLPKDVFVEVEVIAYCGK